ncbi:MAG TPA: hypothetical protein VLH09_14770 [Bryobacteraceae bacterium]|nr:hypothetical protein [Bryobacteraceae bacterium]
MRLNSSYHPNWRAADGSPVLMLAPTHIYTTVSGTTELRFRRTGIEVAALVVSCLTFVAVTVGLLWPRHR